MTVHMTQVGGLRATWVRQRDGIAILNVHNLSRTVDEELPSGVDLVGARESRPDLAVLWDRVRRDFWDGYASTPGSSAPDVAPENSR